MASEHMKARTVVSVALNSMVDLDKPVIVRLGLEDKRTVGVGSWSTQDGQLVLTLTDDHDFFPVDRYALGVPTRTVRRTHSENRSRGMFATDAEKAKASESVAPSSPVKVRASDDSEEADHA